MFQEINIRELPENAVSLIADRWLLITAGNQKNYNMMTGSWGALGEMWGKDIAVTVIRPTRYTYDFMEQEEYFTLSILDPKISKAVHSICGSKSGREVDKILPALKRNGIRKLILYPVSSDLKNQE